MDRKKLSEFAFVAGLLALCAGAFLFAVWTGFLVLGGALCVVGLGLRLPELKNVSQETKGARS